MLNGQVVVVTGAAGTIGAPACMSIAEQGGLPIVTDIDQEAADRLTRRIVDAGYSAQALALDITDKAAIDALIDTVTKSHGRIDGVVNSAYPRGANYGRLMEDVDIADFNNSLSSHLGGYFLVCQRFGRAFREQGGGNIVNLASIYGVAAPAFDMYAGTQMTMPVEYAAIKAGVIGLTRYFAQYYLKDGVRCNALAPGGVRADQPESFVSAYEAKAGTRGLLDAADLTGPILFLLSDASRYMTGQVLVIDDGWSL